MTCENIIIGSGPTAATLVSQLLKLNKKVTVIDIGNLIEKKNLYKFYLPLPLINFLCKLKILDYKKINNLLNQRIYYNYYDLIKKRIKINQLKKITKIK
jgi:hypothetical protein